MLRLLSIAFVDIDIIIVVAAHKEIHGALYTRQNVSQVL